nr:hypothetical protein [Microctonus hyperodae filamentous virus]
MSLEKREYKFGNLVADVFIFIDEKGNFWFKAKEIATVLEYTNTPKAISNNVESCDRTEWNILIGKGSNSITSLEAVHISPNWQPHTVFINESGLYSLMWSSKKPEARLFRRWVTNEVIPSLRKTGKYEVNTRPPTSVDLEVQLIKKRE